nr:unnamed protein product [Callosobruchus analis]
MNIKVRKAATTEEEIMLKIKIIKPISTDKLHRRSSERCDVWTPMDNGNVLNIVEYAEEQEINVDGKLCKTPLDISKLSVDHEVIDLIVQDTNKYAWQKIHSGGVHKTHGVKIIKWMDKRPMLMISNKREYDITLHVTGRKNRSPSRMERRLSDYHPKKDKALMDKVYTPVSATSTYAMQGDFRIKQNETNKCVQ